MTLEANDFFNVGKVTAKMIYASSTEQKKINNGSGGALFYKTEADVDTGDTEIAVGTSYTTEVPVWIISASTSKVFVEHLTGIVAQDITVSDDLTVTDDLTVKDDLKVEGLATVGETLGVTGVTTPTGGVASVSGAAIGGWAGNFTPASKTAGTDVAFAEKQLFVTSVFVPVNKKVKGIAFLLGTEGGTNKLVAGLFNAKGELLAKTTETTEGTVAGTKETIQSIDLTAEYEAVGPAVYFIGVTGNGNTAKLRAIPIGAANVLTTKTELATKNTLAKFTAPTTFTADVGIVAALY